MRLGYVRGLVLGGIVMGALGCDGGDNHNPSKDSGTAVGDAGEAAAASLYVANGGSSSVSVIDPISLKVIDVLKLDAEYRPHHLSVSPDGKTVLLAAPNADLAGGHGGAAGGGHSGATSADAGAHGGGGAATVMSAVYAIDAATRKERRLAEIDATVHNAAFTRDGKQVLLGMMEHGMLMAYDAASFAEAWSLQVGEMPLEVSPTPDGKTALVALSGSAQLAIVDLAAKKASTVPTGMTPVGAWIGKDDAYVTNEGDMTINVVSLKDLTVKATYDAGGMPGQAFTSPDGKELWIALEDVGKVRIVEPLTGAKIAEISAGTKPHGIAFEPSGARVFVTDEMGAKVLVFDRVKRTQVGSIDVGEEPNGIVWVAAP